MTAAREALTKKLVVLVYYSDRDFFGVLMYLDGLLAGKLSSSVCRSSLLVCYAPTVLAS